MIVVVMIVVVMVMVVMVVVVVMVILTHHSVVPIEHSRMGLAKGRPGSLSK